MKYAIINCGGGTIWDIENADSPDDFQDAVLKVSAVRSGDQDEGDFYILDIEGDQIVGWDRVEETTE